MNNTSEMKRFVSRHATTSSGAEGQLSTLRLLSLSKHNSQLSTPSYAGGGVQPEFSAVGRKQQFSHSNGEIVEPLATMESRRVTTTPPEPSRRVSRSVEVSKCRSVQVSKHPSIEASKCPSVEASKHPSVQVSKHQLNGRPRLLTLNFSLLTVLLCLMFGGTAWGQSITMGVENLELGTGTSTGYYPMPGFYGWQYDVYLYKPSDLPDLANDYTFKSISYNISSNSTTTGAQMTIWIKDVDASFALATATTFDSYIDGATQVYNNTAFTSTAGWNTFSFSSPFNHTAGKAILVAVRGVGCGTGGGCSRYCYYTSVSNTHWYKHQDNTDPGQSVSGSSVDGYRANIMLGYVSNTLTQAISCGTPYNFYDSGGSTGQYSSSENYTATFTCAGNITLSFSSFNTESNYDKLSVYDGDASGTVLIDHTSGTTAPSAVTATSGIMTVVWSSDGSVTKAGWEATVTGVKLSPTLSFSGPTSVGIGSYIDCVATPSVGDATVTYTSSNTSVATVSPSGRVTGVAEGTVTITASISGDPCANNTSATRTITVTPMCMSNGLTKDISCGTNYNFYDSGGASGDYSAGEDMTATFTSNGIINLSFSSFETESVTYDYMYVYDGDASTGTVLINKAGGSTVPSAVTASSGIMTVVWHSDGSVQKAGWAATISATNCVACRGDEDIIMANGLQKQIECGTSYCFFDEGGPDGNYSTANAEHYATFTSEGDITLSFSSFTTESATYDYMYVYDGDASSGAILINKAGGSTIPSTVTATSGTMTVYWRTDGSVFNTGWAAKITANRCDDCHGDEQIIMANGLSKAIRFNKTYCFYDEGGYANGYTTNSADHYATFTSSGDITLSFSMFNTESSCDKLTVYDGTSSGTVLLNAVSGTTIPNDVTAFSGTMTVWWHTDGSVLKSGWVGSIIAEPHDPCRNATEMTCGQTYSGTLGTEGVWYSYTNAYDDPGEEHVYTFTPSVSGNYVFTATEVDGDPDFFLSSTCGNEGENLVGGTWSSGNKTVSLTAGTTYYLVADNYSEDETAEYEVSVSLSSIDALTASPTTVCYGDQVTLTAPAGGSSYSWSVSGSGSTITPTVTENTTYYVTVWNGSSCSASSSVAVSVNTYTVTWNNWDGTTLETDNGVLCGTTPTYNGATPTRAADAQYTYTFTGWSPTVSPVTGNVTYTAQYSATVNKYTVTIATAPAGYGSVNYTTIANVPYGTSITTSNNTLTVNGTTVTATPTPADAQYTYTFDNWSGVPSPATVTGNVTITANFTRSVNNYTVTIVASPDGYGSVDHTSVTSVPYGTAISTSNNTLTVNGTTVTATPTPADAQYTYTFDNWSGVPSPATVTGNVTITANFTRSVNNYTVTIVASPDGYGSVDHASVTSVPYGTAITTSDNTLTVNGTTVTATPTPADAQYTYTFDNWSGVPSPATVTGNVTITANFTRTVNTYVINISANPVASGSVSGNGTYDYGETCELTATPNDGYCFKNWTVNGNVVSIAATYSFTVTNDSTWVANFVQSINANVTSISECLGANQNVIAEITAGSGGTYTYNWQMLDGSNWVSAPNASNSSTYTPSATLVGTTTYKVEIVDEVAGCSNAEFTFTATVNSPSAEGLTSCDYIWRGGSTNWNAASNWYEYDSINDIYSVASVMPDAPKNYYIGTGSCLPSDEWPSISDVATVGNVTINGGSVTVSSSGTLRVAGSLAGAITTAAGSSVVFCGSGVQTISNNLRFDNVTFDMSGEESHIIVNSGRTNPTITVSGTATFSNGIVDGNMVFEENALSEGATKSSYVAGQVSKTGNGSEFIFPTGDDNVLGSVKAEIENNKTVWAKFHHKSDDNGDGTHGYTTDEIPRWWHTNDMCLDDESQRFYHISNFEYWQISSPVELTDVELVAAATSYSQHFQTPPSQVNTGDIQVAAYSGDCWRNFGGGVEISGTDNNIITITGATIPVDPSYRAAVDFLITLGSTNPDLVLPIELLSFTATCDGKSSLVEWTTATERNNDYFSLERSDDAINFTEIARIAGAGNSIEPLDYSYTDFGIHGGDNYYRLVQVDYDGTRTISEIVVANCIEPEVAEPDVQAYPNPFNDELTVVLDNFGNRAATIEVYDMLGKLIYTNKIAAPQNSYETILNLSNLPPAAYTVRVSTADFVINKNVVKN
ncbi:MAG: T9SS type A sorting domain-containing protein [Bacteroidales bacterium]|nr:T9SS type A sorting domain-containing protein [Bacteroidales bacterium]